MSSASNNSSAPQSPTTMQPSSVAAKASESSETPTRPSAAAIASLPRTQRSPSLGVDIPGEPSTPRNASTAAERLYNLSRTTPTVQITSPNPETSSSLQAPPLSAANTSISSAAVSPVTPGRSRQGSQTHAGGILPPASFFRPSKPNSVGTRTSGGGSFNFPGSPPKSSPIGSIGIGLPFKASSPSASPMAPKGSGLPSSFKTPNLALGGGGDPGARMTKQSREPLLPLREQQSDSKPQPSVADTGSSSVGGAVRGSFERIWRKGGSEATTTPPRRSVDRRSQKSVPTGVAEEAEMDDRNNVDLEAGRKSEEDEMNGDITPMPSPHPEDRNRFVQDDTDSLTVDDIGDGASGGGVVMEMGRLSLADTAVRPMSMADTSVRTSYRTGDTDLENAVIGDAIVFRRSQGAMVLLDSPQTPQTPKTPGGGTGAMMSFSFDTERSDMDLQSPPPNSAHPLAQSHHIPAPNTPGQQSRHARFAPSPRRSPKNIANGKSSSSTTSLPNSSLFHRSSEKGPSSFTASPPYMVPVLSGKSQKPLRNYEIHPSRNKFFFKGHILAGGDSALPFLGALTLVLGIAGTWFGTTCVFWWHRGGGGQAVAAIGAYLCLLTVSSMLMTAFRDPGILPRDLDPDPPCSNGQTDLEDLHVQSITTLLVLATGIVHIYLITHENRWSVKEGFKHAIGSVVVVALCLVVMWPLLALTLYHVRLLLLNITTIEQVRNQAHRKLTQAPSPPNPFTIGRWWHNVAYLLCRPAGYSWVDLPGYSMSDTRKVNPGFIVRAASTVEGDVESSVVRDSRDDWR
ncbi:Eukaryotic peptide chain release factor GTP-binding subunit [Tulasnella sp. 427]|nr:Eukaryotic peptide chain release factor GTP-binding subunit [Tulasnella sp. 427]